MENTARKLEPKINQKKKMLMKRKHTKTKKIGHLKIKNYKFKRVHNFKCL
jgi:hypothetical protein